MNDVPTGNTSETVQQYYNHLYHHYLDTLTQNYYIHWDTLAWVFLWVFVLAGSFYAFTRWQRYTRQSQEPYPVESYDGHIQESNGPVGPFSHDLLHRHNDLVVDHDRIGSGAWADLLACYQLSVFSRQFRSLITGHWSLTTENYSKKEPHHEFRHCLFTGRAGGCAGGGLG
ncbi:MAG: hypothetical protein R2867_18750 [Caldilineaceae bacterium]